MKFLKMFQNKIALRYFIFGLILFGVTIGISLIDSADDVKVTFDTETVQVLSDRYTMTIAYQDIQQVTLAQMPDAGTSVDGKDTVVLRYGVWNNDVWGEYHICADLDATNCIVVKIQDGRTLVFSSKNNANTESLYNELLTHVPAK